MKNYFLISEEFLEYKITQSLLFWIDFFLINCNVK